MIEPIRELLDRSIQTDKSDRDRRWEMLLREELYSVEVDMNCVLTEVKMDVRKLAALKAGDIIPIDKPGKVNATIEKIPLVRGSFGESRGKSAFKVDHFLQLNPAVLENLLGAPALPGDPSENEEKKLSNF